MAITTPDAVPGEVIEAAWGDAVRADLQAHDTAIATKVAKGGDLMSGDLSWTRTDPTLGAGALVRVDGPIVNSLTGAAGHTTTSISLALGRGGGAGNAGGIFVGFRGNSSSSSAPHTNLLGTITVATANTSVAYNTTSDKRLKSFTRLVDPDEATAKVAALEPVNYTWRDAPEAGEQIGLFAQDAYTVAPEAVTPGNGEPGDDDFIPWGVDLTKLVPTLIAAIQALTARITALETGT